MPVISKTSRFSDNAFYGAVDCLDFAERDFYITVIKDSVKMFSDHHHKIFQWFQPLPSELCFPTIKEFERPGSFGIKPQGTEDFFEVIGGTESFIQCERFFEQALLLGGQIEPAAEEQPSFASYQFPFFTTLTEELASSYFIDCIIQVTDQMEFIEDDPGVFTERFDTGSKRFPHIHTHDFDGLAESRSRYFEKSIQRHSLMTIRNANDSPFFKVADDGIHVIHPAETDLIHSKPANSMQWTTMTVISFQQGIFYACPLMPGYFVFFRGRCDGVPHTVFKNHALKATGEAGSAINKKQSFASHATAGTVDPAAKQSEKYLPVKNRFISIQSYGPVLDTGYYLTASITDGAVSIEGHYSNNGGHGILEKFGVCCINRKTIDSNKGIEYFLCSWHLVFLLTLWVIEKDRSRMRPNANFLFNQIP
jgi:hypothetical protein